MTINVIINVILSSCNITLLVIPNAIQNILYNLSHQDNLIILVCVYVCVIIICIIFNYNMYIYKY